MWLVPIILVLLAVYPNLSEYSVGTICDDFQRSIRAKSLCSGNTLLDVRISLLYIVKSIRALRRRPSPAFCGECYSGSRTGLSRRIVLMPETVLGKWLCISVSIDMVFQFWALDRTFSIGASRGLATENHVITFHVTNGNTRFLSP
jgi:hypothetical protein